LGKACLSGTPSGYERDRRAIVLRVLVQGLNDKPIFDGNGRPAQRSALAWSAALANATMAIVAAPAIPFFRLRMRNGLPRIPTDAH
jgi:hypothetical protein